MRYKISSKLLSDIVSSYQESMRLSVGPEIKFVDAEIEHLTWDVLLEEPIFLINYYGFDEDIYDSDGFFFCRDIIGFSMDDESENELERRFGVDNEKVEKLFIELFKEFISNNSLPTMDIIEEIYYYNYNLIKIMNDIEFFNKLENEEKEYLYKVTNDTLFLPKDVTDIFVF